MSTLSHSGTTPLHQGRYAVLDSLRGLGCLQVVVFHFILTTGRPLLDYWFIFNSWISLDFFFVLSGFVIVHVYGGGKLRDFRSTMGFAVRRFGRIWPLHIAVLGSLVLFIGVLNLGFDHPKWMTITVSAPPYSLLSLISEFFLMNAVGVWDDYFWNVPSWSMGAEFCVYMIFALVCLVTRNALVIGAAVMATVALIVLGTWSPKYLSADINLGVFRCMAGFFFGVIAYRAHVFVVRRWPSIVGLRNSTAGTVAEVGVLAAVTVFVFYLNAFGTFSAISLASPPLFAIVVFIFAFACGGVSYLLDRPVFHRLGDFSYSIYVTHWPLLVVLWYVLWQVKRHFGLDISWYFENSRLLSSLGLLPFAALVVLVSSFTFKTIEVPWRARFAMIGRKIEGKDERATHQQGARRSSATAGRISAS